MSGVPWFRVLGIGSQSHHGYGLRGNQDLDQKYLDPVGLISEHCFAEFCFAAIDDCAQFGPQALPQNLMVEPSQRHARSMHSKRASNP
eukprot:6466964-Amphidinium_carterae.2